MRNRDCKWLFSMELASIPVATTDRQPGDDLSLDIQSLRCINLYSLFGKLSNNQQYVDFRTLNNSPPIFAREVAKSVMGCRITGRHCLVEQTYAKLTGDDVPFVWPPERASRLSRSTREHLHDLLWDQTPG